jgi:phosphoserine phosphatase
MQPTSVLATISGRDRPGVTAAFFAALAAHDVEVRDVEQVVIRDRLVLAVLFDLHGDPAALRNSVSQAARALGMDSEVTIAGVRDRPDPATASSVIVMGHSLRPGALSHVAQRIADVEGNIESVTQLSTEPAASLEMSVRAPDPAELRAVLVAAARETGLDIAVEPAGLRRRAKRLVLLDADATLVPVDIVDALADRAGVSAEMAALAERTARGDLDFATSVQARAALLARLPAADLDAARDRVRATPGAQAFVRTLHGLGYRVGVLSEGFTFVTDRLKQDLELDFAAAHELEVAAGATTGRMLGPILDPAGKAQALRRFATEFGVRMSQTVAVGDGTNDVDLLVSAGLGIACNAKSALHDAAADESPRPRYLDTVLSVLGISGPDPSRDPDVTIGGEPARRQPR